MSSQRVPLTQYQQIPQQQSSEIVAYGAKQLDSANQPSLTSGQQSQADGTQVDNERLQSVQMLVDPDIVTQVYHAYAV